MRNQASGFSLLELMVAVTITALLSTAVIASFRMGISSWRRGEDFLDRSQRLSVAAELIQKQIGSANPLYPVSALNVVSGLNKPRVQEAQDAPAFQGEGRDLVFVTNYPLVSRPEGSMQVIHYTVSAEGDPGNRIGRVGSQTVSSSSALQLWMTSAPIFRREAFFNLTSTTGTPGASSLKLLEGIRDITFQYWAEEQISSQGPGDPGSRRMVTFDQWDGSKRRRLPDAVFIKVQFTATSNGPEGRNPYNRDSIEMLVPISVGKSD
ncbi:MAG: type II secretion system GspH family protein [Acidobacteriia bacterium]|nr:type II secretion system GspH family protein [Terriglobia bacterium]